MVDYQNVAALARPELEGLAAASRTEAAMRLARGGPEDRLFASIYSLVAHLAVELARVKYPAAEEDARRFKRQCLRCGAWDYSNDPGEWPPHDCGVRP